LAVEKSHKRVGPVLGFYWRKLFFFAAIFAVAIFVYSNTKVYKADQSSYSPPSYNSDLNVDMTVNKDGSISVDGKKIAARVNQVAGFDEVRLPLLDNTGNYYDSVSINLSLPQPVAALTNYELLVIHSNSEVTSSQSDERTIRYTASNVAGTATLTVIAQMPQGTVKPPLMTRISNYLGGLSLDSWALAGLALPLLTVIFMILLIMYEFRRQKVEKPAEDSDQPPMALPPAVVGILYRQKVTPREIAATIIDLAIRGDIYILDRERDFAFSKNKFDRRLLSFEKILLSKIFSKSMVSGQADFEERINRHLYSKKISLVSSGIYVLATRLGYFRVNPQSQHMKYLTIGLITFFAGVAGILLSLWKFQSPPFIIFFWVGMIVSAIIIMVLAQKIPLRTVLGQEALSNWLAFKRFLSDRGKIPFSYENVRLFEKYLPYAIVLDCEVAWAKRFSEQNFAIPDWFVSGKDSLGLSDFCLTLFPIVSYVGRSLAAIREPGFK